MPHNSFPFCMPSKPSIFQIRRSICKKKKTQSIGPLIKNPETNATINVTSRPNWSRTLFTLNARHWVQHSRTAEKNPRGNTKLELSIEVGTNTGMSLETYCLTGGTFDWNYCKESTYRAAWDRTSFTLPIWQHISDNGPVCPVNISWVR